MGSGLRTQERRLGFGRTDARLQAPRRERSLQTRTDGRPRAGRGHDAREFARHGFQVTAIDFASHAIHEMKRLADPNAPVEILQHDLFSLPHELDNSFDYLLEYTCFCAIDPKRRGEYADLVTRLLRPGGTYIDLAFPPDGRAGGPR